MSQYIKEKINELFEQKHSINAARRENYEHFHAVCREIRRWQFMCNHALSHRYKGQCWYCRATIGITGQYRYYERSFD